MTNGTQPSRRGAPVRWCLGEDPPPADYLVVAEDYPNQAFAAGVLPRVQDRVRRGDYRPACRYGNVTAFERVHR